MKNSMTMVAAIGVCGLFFVVMMYYGVAGYTPAGKLARVAASIKDRLSFEEVDVELAGREERRTLRVTYTTGNHLEFDAVRQNNEMAEAANLALQACPEEEREGVRSVNVRRVEISGAGCFKDRYESTLDVDIQPTTPKTSPRRSHR